MVATGGSENQGTELNNHLPERNISKIRNKQRRIEEYLKLKREKKKEKCQERKKRQKEAKMLGKDAPPKQVPRTIENTREADETFVDPTDEEIQFDLSRDEMSSYFEKQMEPKVLITTSEKPHTKTLRFARELKQTIPNACLIWRRRSAIKNLINLAIQRKYTHIVVINEDKRNPNALLISHLPEGPTAYFRMSSVKFCKDIKKRTEWSAHRPEIILNNFNTRLGQRVGRMIASLFHYDPEFHGRRVVTFHNQRDYIFIRHHRYEFKNNQRVALAEIGPRFTLKLQSLQKGTFDSKYGEYEWVLKRHEMETSRRRFFL